MNTEAKPNKAPKKIGIMISAAPGDSTFENGIAQAEAALREGRQVYLYWIDHAVEGLRPPELARLKAAGAHLFACAYSLQKRGLSAPPEVTLSGLTILSDILSSTDEFQSFS